MKKVYDEKEGENWDKSPQKKWDKGAEGAILNRSRTVESGILVVVCR